MNNVAVDSRVVIEIGRMTDCCVAPSVTRRFAMAAGMDVRRSWELGIVAGELASNIVKHCGASGSIELRHLGSLIELIADDRGPGLADPARLLCAGQMRLQAGRGLVGLGCGGSSLVRLLDAVSVLNRDGGGLRVHGVKRFDGKVGL